jgi:hypothetical protein
MVKARALRADLDEELTEEFDDLKHHFAIKLDSDSVRHLIHEYHMQL